MIDPLALIRKYESPGGNVLNFRFDPTHTASGYYQITNTTWRQYASADVLARYPTAISAPYDVQSQVAGDIYNARGFQDWAPFNPKLASAISSAGSENFPTPGTYSVSQGDPSLLGGNGEVDSGSVGGGGLQYDIMPYDPAVVSMTGTGTGTDTGSTLVPGGALTGSGGTGLGTAFETASGAGGGMPVMLNPGPGFNQDITSINKTVGTAASTLATALNRSTNAAAATGSSWLDAIFGALASFLVRFGLIAAGIVLLGVAFVAMMRQTETGRAVQTAALKVAA